MFTDKILLVMVGAFAILGIGFGIYFKISQDQIETLTANLAKTEQAVKLQEKTISDMQEVATTQKYAIESMQTQLNKAESDRATLAAQIRNLNIIQNAQTNRPLLQTNMNTQLNELFNSVIPGATNVKKP